MIRVSVAASSAIVRAGLETVVRSNETLELAEVVRSDQVEDGTQNITGDILLLELSHVNEDWFSTLSEFPVPVVLLTEPSDSAFVSAAIRAGIRGLLSPDASPAEIAAAICSAAAGLFTLQQSAAELFANEPRAAPAALEEPLSPRELEVLAMLAEGLSNKLIAHNLGISDHTVKFHVTQIMAKLHAASRTDAVMQGIRRGLVMV